jgi:hypothetical protein
MLSTYLKNTSLGVMVKHNVRDIYIGNDICVYEDYMWFYLEYIIWERYNRVMKFILQMLFK